MYCPAFQIQTTCLLTGGRALVRTCPLLPQPRGKSSRLLPLRASLPQILGTAQAGDQEGPAPPSACLGETWLSWHQEDPGPLSSATPGPERLPLVPLALYGTHCPGLGPGSHKNDDSSETLGSQPLVHYRFQVLFLWERRAFWGNLWKPQLSLFSFLHPLGRKEGKGPKALQAIISQLLVSKISVGSQFRTLR